MDAPGTAESGVPGTLEFTDHGGVPVIFDAYQGGNGCGGLGAAQARCVPDVPGCVIYSSAV